MRIAALMVLAALPMAGFAQSRFVFRDTALSFSELDATFLRYGIVSLHDSLTTLGDNTSVTISHNGDQTFSLQDSRLLSDDYRIRMSTPAGIVSLRPDETGFDGRYYTGTGSGAQKVCAFSTFEGQNYIFVRDSSAAYYIEPLTVYVPSADKDLYVYYTPADLKPVAATCGTAPHNTGQPQTAGSTTIPLAGGCVVTELAIMCDYSLFTKYGSVNAILHRTINVTNLTNTDYRTTSGLVDNVRFRIVEHFVVTCDTCNPWVATTNINNNLDSIRIKASQFLVNTYDLAQYWFNNPTFSSGTVGLAYVGVLCNNFFRYSAILDFTSSYANMRNLNSHELGHNFDCDHDAQNSGFIMAPSVNGSAIWSAASIGRIDTTVSTSSACLAACPAGVALCDTLGVNDLTVNKDSLAKTITLKWTGTAGVGYKARLYRYSTATWTAYTAVAAGIDSVMFTLPAGVCSAKYKAEIIPVCPTNLAGGSKMVVFPYRGHTPVISVSAAPPVMCAGSASVLTASAASGTTYTWSPGATLSSTAGPSVTATPVTTTTYTVVGIHGCTASAPVTVTIVNVPTGTWLGVTSTAWFTPSNWCGTVPTVSTNVVIPATAPFMPFLNAPATVNSFTNLGQMNVGPLGVLTVQ